MVQATSKQIPCELEYSLIVEPEITSVYIKRNKWRKFAIRITLAVFNLLLLLFFLIFIVFPLIYKYSYSLQRNAVFLNFANWPSNSKWTDPAESNLKGAINFYLTTNDGIKLGVWHVLPENVLNETTNNASPKFFEEALNNGQNVVIYNHGNAGTRATSHRVELYEVLRRHFHVIAYDYRSYGDSEKVEPTEDGLVKDVIFMYNWVANKTNSKIFMWGHSLGTGLSMHALALLGEKNIRPYGVFLESPFNNMKDEVAEHPFASIFRSLPWFHYTVVSPMQQNNFTFKSDVFILKVDSPIIILHAEDDQVVPYKLGERLFKTAIANRNKTQGFVKFWTFSSDHNYGHKFICRSPDLSNIIKTFVEDAIKENKEKHLN